MGHYQCCYSSGRQFIFTERPRWIFAGLLMVAIVGLFLGLCIGVTISFAGVLSFELVMFVAALLIAYETYLLTFQRSSSSDDISGYCFFMLMLVIFCVLMLAAARLSLMLGLDAANRCALFGVGFTLLGVGVYGYVLCLQEDERKHYLDICSPDGDVLDRKETEDEGSSDRDNWEAFLTFIRWILTWQWWFDCNSTVPTHGEPSLSEDGEDSESIDVITVHNRTLKLIKVCIYSPEDMFCFVPFGGVSGSGVGLIRTEERRVFTMPRRTGAATPAHHYTLKVFQPGVCDRELARYSKARHGQSLVFFDVEGMVKRSRLLSSVRAAPEPQAPIPQSDTSDDDVSREAQKNLLPLDKDIRLPHTLGSSGGFKRSASSTTLCSLKSSERSSEDSCTARRSGSPKRGTHTLAMCEVRKAGPDEVVVRNRSNQEIRALLYRSTDYCYMVPLVGKLLTCGDCILPDSERRFTPHVQDTDFTLKVYSVGAGARELTYFTVYRGQTYTFCDSLLS